MNINGNFSNERKNLRIIKGCAYKITHVSPTMCSSVSNLVPIQCLDIVHEFAYLITKLDCYVYGLVWYHV